MPRKKKPPMSFAECMAKIAASRIATKGVKSGDAMSSDDALESLAVRVKKILGLSEIIKNTNDRMLFFVMYDIENNKVRRLVSKYLQRKGCTRIQRSVFLGEASSETYSLVKHDLAAVQAAYENDDSIIVLPVSTDYLRMMKIIGQKIEVDVITHSRNTLFF